MQRLSRYIGRKIDGSGRMVLRNIIVGQGSDEIARDVVHGYFDAINEKNMIRLSPYGINQAKTNPVEKQKWMESMKSAPKSGCQVIRAESYPVV